MEKEIDPKLVKVGDYLDIGKDTQFIIPEYQRKYAWEISNCDKLWSDIVNYMDNENKDPYFFGTVIMSCNIEGSKFNLIDGQQRTTTFMLLLKALLIKINDTLKNMVNDSDSEQMKKALRARRREIIEILYSVDPEEITDEPDEENDRKIYNKYNNLINESNQEIYKNELKTIMTSIDYEEADSKREDIPGKQKDNRLTNFFRNFKHFYNKEQLNHPDFLNKFTKTLLKKCDIIRIKSWNVDQAITMFNSLNSDGMPLTDSDIIYSKMYAAAKDEEERKNIGNKWRYLIDLTDKLEKNKIVTITGLLNQKMYLYRTLNGDTRNDIGNIDVTTPGLRNYYTIINQSLIKKPLDFCNELIILAQIWDIVKDNNAMKVLLNFNDNSKLFLASFFHRYDSYFTFDEKDEININDEKKEKLINDVEQVTELMLRLFAVLSLVDAGYSSANFKTFLFREEIKLVDPNISIKEIKQDFINHINDKWNKNDIATKIYDYEKHDIVYLNEYLFAKNNGKSLILYDDIDIEHIMPQSGTNLVSIQKDANIENETEFYQYVNKVGNKILLEYNINRTIGNEWFRTKIHEDISSKLGYVNSKYPLANHLVALYKGINKPYWTKEDIDNATKAASERITDFIFD